MDSTKALRIFNRATAIVTSGASRIGCALAEELAGRDAYVVLVDRRIEKARDVAAHIRASGGGAKAVEADVTDLPGN
jgi:NAD(P)-dependent dehydrogenase (short-subunit alcohol dehydrogenase family)